MAADVYRSLAGIDAPDPLPKLIDWIEEQRARDSGREAAARPVTARDLSLPTAFYAGAYDNADWGTIEIGAEGDHLVSTWGDLRPTLGAAEPDRFVFSPIPGDEHARSFEIEPAAEAIGAPVIELGGRPVRFERTPAVGSL